MQSQRFRSEVIFEASTYSSKTDLAGTEHMKYLILSAIAAKQCDFILHIAIFCLAQ